MTTPTVPDASSIIERLAAALNVKSDVELAKKLDVAPQTVATWKKRNKVPYEKVVEIAATERISLDGLMWGENIKPDVLSLQIEVTLNAVRTSRLLHHIFNFMDQELPLSERMPEEEPFYFISRVYSEVVARLPDGEPLDSEYAIELANSFAKKDMEFYWQTIEIARRNTEKSEKRNSQNRSSSKVTQNFNSKVGQAAAGDINNNGNTKNK